MIAAIYLGVYYLCGLRRSGFDWLRAFRISVLIAILNFVNLGLYFGGYFSGYINEAAFDALHIQFYLVSLICMIEPLIFWFGGVRGYSREEIMADLPTWIGEGFYGFVLFIMIAFLLQATINARFAG